MQRILVSSKLQAALLQVQRCNTHNQCTHCRRVSRHEVAHMPDCCVVVVQEVDSLKTQLSSISQMFESKSDELLQLQRKSTDTSSRLQRQLVDVEGQLRQARQGEEASQRRIQQLSSQLEATIRRQQDVETNAAQMEENLRAQLAAAQVGHEIMQCVCVIACRYSMCVY